MAVQRVWSPTIRKVDVVVEMVWHLSAGYITQEVTLQKLTSIVRNHKQYECCWEIFLSLPIGLLHTKYILQLSKYVA